MLTPHGFRFTIGQSMAVTAFLAVVLAASITDGPYDSAFANPKYLLSTSVHFAGVGVCLYNVRLSRGMWLVIAGYIGPWLVRLATTVTIAVWPSSIESVFVANVLRATWVADVVLSLLFVVGLAMTFRDTRRRLVVHEVAA